METVSNDGSRLSYRRLGAGARHVVLVHGWMMTSAVWDDVLDALDTDGLTLVIPDLRGVGGSTPHEVDYRLQTQAEDLWAVIDAAELERPVVVGHSMGGQVAQLIAAMRPDALGGLVLINPVPARGLPLPDDALGLFATSAGDVDKLGVILDLATVALSSDARARLVSIAGGIDAACIGGALDAWRSGGFEARLGDITAPTLVVSTDDPFLPAELLDEAVTGRIADARREHIEGAGHYPLAESPQRTAELLSGFLRALPA